MLLAAALLLVLVVPSPVAAEDTWASDPAYEDLIEDEVDALVKLLRSAVKGHHRRQAWFLAQRILEVEADHREASQVVDRWDAMALQEGQAPKERWARQRNRALARIGEQYGAFAASLRAADRLGAALSELDLRAAVYGHHGDPLRELLQEDGAIWLETFARAGEGPAVLDAERAHVLLGTHGPELAFPPAFDDAYLETAVRWPAVQVATWGRWRFLTDLGAETALPLLAHLAEVEQWLVATMGTDADADREITDLLFFGDLEDYEAIGGGIVDEFGARSIERFDKRSSLYLHWRNTLLLSSELRGAAWVGRDVALAGQVAPVLARHHLTGQAGSSVRGRGAWLLDGFTGLLEGFALDDEGWGGVDPARCWRLAAARVLHAQGALLPWDEFLDLDQRKADAVRRRKIEFAFGGATREAEVDVVAAQATVFVLGLLTADPEEGPGQLARLVHDLYRRDRLPDIDKTFRWRRGTAVERAQAVLDLEDS
ncbi:MAG: hypothetical protein ACYTG6_01220 [Planctomycetota bacterium]